MLEPRTLEEHRDLVEESCRRRRVAVDLDAAIRLQQQLAALQTELNEAGHRRNEHQEAGRRKLAAAEREAHTAAGRGLKEEAARLDAEVERTRAALEAALSAIPN